MLLAAAAVAGLVLAIHGWATHDKSGLPGPLVGPSSTRPGATSPGTSGPATSSRGTARHATAGPPAPNASGRPSAGPLLSSQSFARYAFRVWPGVPSARAKTAMTGLSISVRRHGNGLLVTAGVAGQHAQQPRFYAGGSRVYVVEAALGDDSGNTDFNLGDDGLIVTDASGRILR